LNYFANTKAPTFPVSPKTPRGYFLKFFFSKMLPSLKQMPELGQST